eukprot:6472957-Amphidinium_carterae.1
MNCHYESEGHLCTLEPSLRVEEVLLRLPAQRGGIKTEVTRKLVGKGSHISSGSAGSNTRGWVADLLADTHLGSAHLHQQPSQAGHERTHEGQEEEPPRDLEA